jgi:hypothetical protein
MLIGRIEGATRVLGKPEGWDDDGGVKCISLAIRDEQVSDQGNVMISAWLPTPEEIALINAGQPVYLWIWGRGHPPVMLTVKPQ